MHTLSEIFQAILAAAFVIAGVRLAWVARWGRRNVRPFRIVAALLALAWGVWFAHAAFGDSDIETMADWARFLQFGNVTVFLLLGFMFKNEQWEIGAAKNLKELEDDG